MRNSSEDWCLFYHYQSSHEHVALFLNAPYSSEAFFSDWHLKFKYISMHNLKMISHIIWLVFFLFPDWYDCSQKAKFKWSLPEMKMYFLWTSVPVNKMLMRRDYKCPVQICISNVAKSSSVEDLNQNLVLFSFGCIYSI